MNEKDQRIFSTCISMLEEIKNLLNNTESITEDLERLYFFGHIDLAENRLRKELLREQIQGFEEIE